MEDSNCEVSYLNYSTVIPLIKSYCFWSENSSDDIAKATVTAMSKALPLICFKSCLKCLIMPHGLVQRDTVSVWIFFK